MHVRADEVKFDELKEAINALASGMEAKPSDIIILSPEACGAAMFSPQGDPIILGSMNCLATLPGARGGPILSSNSGKCDLDSGHDLPSAWPQDLHSSD